MCWKSSIFGCPCTLTGWAPRPTGVQVYPLRSMSRRPLVPQNCCAAPVAPGITGDALELCGTEGRLWIDRSRYEFHPIGRNAQATVVQASSDLDLDHVQNFLECVRSRKLPNGDVLIGHRSAQASHLGNLSYMQKRRIDFDAVREEILPF